MAGPFTPPLLMTWPLKKKNMFLRLPLRLVFDPKIFNQKACHIDNLFLFESKIKDMIHQHQTMQC